MAVETLIIGSGVVAAALSQKLLKHNPKASILVLEAGNRVKTKDFGLWLNYVAANRNANSLPYTYNQDLDFPAKDTPGENIHMGLTKVDMRGARLFNYGGSTMHWGGWAFRLREEDFQLRSRAGHGTDWPYDYSTLEPFYCEAEHYLGVSGDSQDPTAPRSRDFPFRQFPYTLQDKPLSEALDKLGIVHSHLPIARRGVPDVANSPSRHAPCQTTGTCKYCPFGARYVASNYIDDMLDWEDYPNFRIQMDSPVETVDMATKSRAGSVTLRNLRTGKIEVIEAERIIVAAGAIESAKLLLRSRSEHWSEGIGNDNAMVGRNIITHPYFVYQATWDGNPLGLQTEMDFPTLVSRHFDNPNEQPAGKFIMVNPPDTVGFSPHGAMQSGKSRPEIDQLLRSWPTVTLHGMVEVFPETYNGISNSSTHNRWGLAETVIDYSTPPEFKARMAYIQDRFAEVFAQMGGRDVKMASPISFRADHAACMTRMGTDDTLTVVDPDLRVHGVDNLYVCSNASFPNLGAVNPTLTLTALSLKLGAHLISVDGGGK